MRMKKFYPMILPMILRLALTASMTIRPAIAAPSDEPSGTWLTEDGRARVRVERCGAKLEQVCGYIVWMKDPMDAKGRAALDVQNPDAAKRSRPVLGHQLILGLSLSPDQRFHGQIYNAENGKSYEITLWREAADGLQIRGCMMSILCATQTWTPTTDVAPGQLVGLTGDGNGPRADREWAQIIPAKPPKTTRAAR
ncbi:DUF2147 domain-containing protein [Bradyrhizobium sp. S69]|uniref:DUF2147 domain-containing protein n=1 Tax=Bradyrhizobium sp. S69 TaxID=1641856 RepID=UPI001FEDECCF|nr:DUF2147 domain-containing protein [Bradyrhizobium sp. S69]